MALSVQPVSKPTLTNGLPTFDQMMAQTNPTGITLGSLNTPGTTVQSSPTNVAGVTYSSGPAYTGTPTFGDPSVLGASTAAQQQTYTDSLGNTYGSAAQAQQANSIIQQNLAQYDQGIGNVQSGIDRLGNQLNIGNQNIDTGYNQALNQLLQAKANNEQQYHQSQQQTSQDYVGAKNTIGSNAGNSLNGLQRLLGSRGAGGSSTAMFSAPQAVAHEASLQRAGAGQTFGRNNQALDTNWNGYVTGVNNSQTDLGRQRDNNKNGLQAGIDTTRANLLQSLATLQGQKAAYSGGDAAAAAQPYLDQANSFLGQADQLGLQAPIFQVQPTTYNAPSLDSYSANPFHTAQSTGNGALDASVTPYMSLLLGGQKNKQQPNFGF